MAQSALDEAARLCDRYEKLFSISIPGSNVWRINHADGKKVHVSEESFDLIEKALHYCEASQGAFDITVAPIVRMWDMKRHVIPDAEAIATALEHVDYMCIETGIDGEGPWVQLGDPGTQIDLGGIAKGWIADNIGDAFNAIGINGYLIDLGGNILVGGNKPDGSLWKIGIRQPALPSTTSSAIAVQKRAIPLSEGSVVTSGAYERAFVKGGKLYHHILDPKTGYPAECEYPSVSIIAKKSIDAEGFSTTFLALGFERSKTIAEAHPEIIQAYFTDWDGSVVPLLNV